MDEVMIFWLVFLIVAIVVELLTMGLTTIWFAGGALVAIFAALLGAQTWLQLILFLGVSLLLLSFTRPVAVKYFNKDRIKTNAESIVGRQAIVTGEIDNMQGIGQVTVSGQEWTARCCDDRQRLAVGSVVQIVAINGVKLIVKPDAQTLEKGPVPSAVPEPMSVSQIEEMESPKPEQYKNQSGKGTGKTEKG